MEGRRAGPSAQQRGGPTAAWVVTGPAPRPEPAFPGGRTAWRDLTLLAVLLGAAIGLRAWHLTHTEVAARDSIGYIRYAWQLSHEPWLKTIADPKQQQHPGYPLAIALMSPAVRAFDAGPDSLVMQLSAQLVSAIASVLLVVPMYFLGRDLFHRSAGFWATLIVQCLPASGRILTDGLSEGLFLLLAVTAFYGAVRAFQTRSPGWFGVAGAFSALAYLTRPEGALIAGATGLVLLASQCTRAGRTGWRRFLACGAALTLTAVVLGCPLYAITGQLTVKATPRRILHPGSEGPTEPPPLLSLAGGAAPDMPLFAVWLYEDGRHASSSGLKAVIAEFVKGYLYVLWLPLLLGLWWFRDRFRVVPGAWVLLLVSLAILGLMWRVASVLGYVSDRHLLLPLLCGTYWAVAAVPGLVTTVSSALRRWPVLARWKDRLPAATSPVWTVLLLTAFVAATLPKTLEPLHANRDGFRDAGLWLADHARPWDEVIDPYCWSHYYAGKVFLERESPEPPPGETKVCYVVLENALNDHPRLLSDIDNAKERARRGHAVQSWSGHRGDRAFEVVVYETPSP